MSKAFLDTLSIQPSFECNYNCPYCYLGDLRKNKTLLNLNTLKYRLIEILKGYEIRNITLYGGEISLLSKDYLKSLVDMCKGVGTTPAIVSNLSNDWIIDFCEDNQLPLSISLNEERPYYKETLEKVRGLKNKHNKNLSIVVLPSLLKKDHRELMEFYSSLGIDLFFIQYHPSIHSKISYSIAVKEFSDFLRNMIAQSRTYDYGIKIINEEILRNPDYNPLMSGFLFITPEGKFSTVEYRSRIEHYIDFDSLEEWKEYCKKEYREYYQKCNLCKYFGKCKAEHLEIMGEENCSGLYDLQEWYEESKWNL